MLSPVKADSSTKDCPSIITPSTGSESPGFIIIISPVLTNSTGTCSSIPFLSTVAVFGVKSISFLMASDVFLLERASKNLPSVISVRIMAADSKYRS